jgi:hypothetical protein
MNPPQMHRSRVFNRWWRAGAIVAIVVLCGALGAADASAKKSKKPVATPAFYTLKSPKQHCRVNYTRQRITITEHKRHGKKIRRIRIHEVRCIYTGSRGADGAPVSFPTDLPTAAITVSVIPTAGDASYTIAAGEVLAVGGAGVLTGNGGSGLTASVVSTTTHGVLTLNRDGTFRYAPAASFSGIDSFTFRTLTSSGESSTPASVRIHVTPVAIPVGAYYLPASGTLSVAAPGVLTGDTGSDLTAKLVSNASTGSLTLNADGAFTYTPTPNFSGSDSFTFEAVDSSGQATAAVTVTIDIGVQAPSVVAESFGGAVGNTEYQVGGSRGSGPEAYVPDQSALDGDSDPNGGTLSTTPATITTTAGGTVTLAGDGTFVYQPPTGFSGASDSFTYEVDTSEGTSAQASATIYFGSDARVWYAYSSAPAGGDGSSTAPFDSLTAATAAAGPDDYIFLYGSTTPYAGGESLGADETLVGQPAGLTVDSEDLLAASSGQSAEITSGGVGLTLGGGDELDGVTIENTTGDAVSMGNGAFVIQDVTITDAGGNAISAQGDATLTVTDSQITGSHEDGIYVDDTDDSSFQDFDLSGDVITATKDAAISLTFAGSANGNIDGNTIGVGTTSGGTTTAGSGSVSGDGIDLTGAGSGAFLYADVFSNQIYGVAEGAGINAESTDGGTLQLPMTANFVFTDATSAGNGVTISAGTSGSDTGVVCTEQAENTVSVKGAGNAFEVEEPDASSQFGIQGYTGGPSYSGVAAFVSSDNTLSAAGPGAPALATPSGSQFTGCTVRQPNI